MTTNYADAVQAHCELLDEASELIWRFDVVERRVDPERANFILRRGRAEVAMARDYRRFFVGRLPR